MNPFSPLIDHLIQLRDRRFVNMVYEHQFSRKMNWKHPTRFCDKVQIFKISREIEDLWPYVDKYEVRNYIEQKIGSSYLNPILGVYNTVEEIQLEKLPKSFALKATHGSGWNILCPDKEKLDWKETKEKLNTWLGLNYYESFGRERQYKKIPPRIICETYLETKNKDLIDFKFYCFHGKPYFINIIKDRSGVVRKAFYDMNWEKMRLQPWDAQADFPLERPKDLEKMVEIASILAAPFSQVRVDLYNISGRTLFGELTFTSGGGMHIFDPDEYDTIFGKLWNYP